MTFERVKGNTHKYCTYTLFLSNEVYFNFQEEELVDILCKSFYIEHPHDIQLLKLNSFIAEFVPPGLLDIKPEEYYVVCIFQHLIRENSVTERYNSLFLRDHQLARPMDLYNKIH